MNEEQLEKFLEAYVDFLEIPDTWERISEIKNQEIWFQGMNTSIKNVVRKLFAYNQNRDVLDSFEKEIRKLDFSDNSPLKKLFNEITDINNSYDFENERFYSVETSSEKAKKETVEMEVLEKEEEDSKKEIVEMKVLEKEEEDSKKKVVENEKSEDEIDRNLNVHINEEEDEEQIVNDTDITAERKDSRINSYSRGDLKEFAKLIFNYGEILKDDKDTRFTEEQKETYDDMFIYLCSGVDKNGYLDADVTYNFLDVLAEYQVEQYTSLGREIEKVKNDLKLDPNLSGEELAKQETMRDQYAKSVAAYNTVQGHRLNALAVSLTNADYINTARDLEAKLGIDAYGSLVGVYFEIVDRKANEKLETLSDEEKNYFEIGRNGGIGKLAPNVAKYDEYPQEWHDYAEERKNELDAYTNKFIEKNGIENKYYKDYVNAKQNALNFANKFDDILATTRELTHIPSFGHMNSDKYLEIVYACRACRDMEIDDNDKKEMQSHSKAGIRLRKSVDGKMARFENALTDYLEDKWKPRKSPIGEKRFDKVFEILEKTNPEKAELMREFHAMKNASNKKKTVDFKTYCQNKKAEKESISFNALIHEEGSAKDFVVIDKVGLEVGKGKVKKVSEKAAEKNREK